MSWQRPRYSRVEVVVAGLMGFVLAWALMAAACIKRPPTPSPVILDTGADVCSVTL